MSITGTIRIHPRGFGFVQPDEREQFPEDIFIPPHATRGAVDGDSVEVIPSPIISEKGPEGRVSKILHRARSHLAGTITTKLKNGGGYAYVPLLGEDRPMRILPQRGERELQVGDRIIIHVVDWGSKRRESMGEMSAYIGHISDPSCDVKAAVEEYNLEDAFSKKILDEAKAFGTQVNIKDLKDRVDLRELECLTIDPATAKDYDDALSLTQDTKGNFHLGVHIADVSHYVTPGSPLDREARRRCNSTYFPGTVLPMLPHELSSHLCSLKPNVNRLALSVMMTLDEEGNLKHYEIFRSVIRSKKRLTYEEAKEILDGKLKSKHAKVLFLMVDLCHRLKQKRFERGCIEFALPDVSIEVDKEGVPKKVKLVEYDITHQLVEEFMLKANEIVATHLYHEGQPLTYRIHEEPNPENIRDFSALANALGFKISSDPSSEELQDLFDEARESPFGQFLTTSFIRSMKLASYSTQNVGHYGLGLEHYTHFTSPIRRYIDLIVHRLLFDQIDPKEDLEAIATQCSEKERLAAKAENSVILLKKLRLLRAMQKKAPSRYYEAVITAVKPVGFAFELIDFLYEGFLPLSKIEAGRTFVFDEKRKRLKSRPTRRTFKTGDQIAVSLKYVNLITNETEWSLR